MNEPRKPEMRKIHASFALKLYFSIQRDQTGTDKIFFECKIFSVDELKNRFLLKEKIFNRPFPCICLYFII